MGLSGFGANHKCCSVHFDSALRGTGRHGSRQLTAHPCGAAGQRGVEHHGSSRYLALTGFRLRGYPHGAAVATMKVPVFKAIRADVYKIPPSTPVGGADGAPR